MKAEAAIAVVRGEALTEAPAALYIPPAALRVMLDEFEGPLDLLLFLVRKHKFDILDIPMRPLCRQYAAYVEAIVGRDLELAADYLAMSALLIEIKTKMLLPRPPGEEEDEEDPRADLVRRLLEYERLRKAAADIAALPRRERDFISPYIAVDLTPPKQKPSLQASLLASAMSAVMARKRQLTPYLLSPALISVREVMSDVLRRLAGGMRFVFHQLAKPHQGGVTFLALLQLALEQDVTLHQRSDGDELYIQGKSGGAA